MAERNRREPTDEWRPRGAMRGLLWWPPVAFLLALWLPGAGLLWIAVAGAALGAGGWAIPFATRCLRRRRTRPVAPLTSRPAASPAPALTPSTGPKIA